MSLLLYSLFISLSQAVREISPTFFKGFGDSYLV